MPTNSDVTCKKQLMSIMQSACRFKIKKKKIKRNKKVKAVKPTSVPIYCFCYYLSPSYFQSAEMKQK